MTTKYCVICNKSFIVGKDKRSKSKQTCSKSCSSKLAYKNQLIIKNCCRCNSETTTSLSVVNSNLPIYCDNCRNLRYEKKCVICNKNFYSAHKETLVCSKDCKVIYIKNKTSEVICDNCGKVYTQLNINLYSNKRHFCSSRCSSAKWASEHKNRYGFTWDYWRKLIKHRDDYKCLLCNDSNELEVHHFIKLNNFDNPDDAHYNDNLGTFCKTCHKFIETLEFNSIHDFNERYSPTSIEI